MACLDLICMECLHEYQANSPKDICPDCGCAAPAKIVGYDETDYGDDVDEEDMD